MAKIELITFLEKIIKDAYSKIIIDKRNEMNITDKGSYDIVTTHDIMIENYIVKKLKERFPNDAVIGEETHQDTLTGHRTWIIDPIDGTVNYALNHPLYGIQVGLIENNEGIISCVYLPAIDEFYYAIKGEGAYLNDQPITVTGDIPLNKAIVTFGDFSKSNPQTRPIQIHMMEEIMDRIMKVRIQGASSIDFSFVASGKTHAHIMFSKRIWEIIPGLLLAQEAGAITHRLEYNLKDFTLEGAIIASNKTLNDLIIGAIEKQKN